jgi:hypothetical protein
MAAAIASSGPTPAIAQADRSHASVLVPADRVPRIFRHHPTPNTRVAHTHARASKEFKPDVQAGRPDESADTSPIGFPTRIHSQNFFDTNTHATRTRTGTHEALTAHSA